MSRKRLENIRVNKRRQAEAEAKRAKRQFGVFLASGTIATAAAGGYYNFNRHDQIAEAKKKELRKVQIEFSTRTQGFMLRAVMKEMAESKIGMQEAFKKLYGIDLADKKYIERLNSDIGRMRREGAKAFEDPEVFNRLGKAGLNMVGKMDPSFVTYMNDAQGRAAKIWAEIQKEDAPVKNTLSGAGAGACVFLVPVMLYVSAKRVRSHFRILAAKREETQLQEEKLRAAEEAKDKAAALAQARESAQGNGQAQKKQAPKEAAYSEFDSNLDAIATMLEDAGMGDADAGKAASVIMATFPPAEARVAALSEKKLLGKLLSQGGLKKEMATAGLSVDVVAFLKKSVEWQPKEAKEQEENGASDINLPKEIYLTPGPAQELATINPRGVSGRDLRRIIEGYGFELRVGGNLGHLYVYDNGEPVRGEDGRQVVIIAHGDSVGKSHVRAVGKRLANYLWKKKGNGNGGKKGE